MHSLPRWVMTSGTCPCHWSTGDQPAVSQMAGLNGYRGKAPRRDCMIKGHRFMITTSYYYASRVRTLDGRDVALFSYLKLPSRQPAQCYQTTDFLQQLNGQERQVLKRESEISGTSVLLRLPTIVAYRSFPPDIMHMFYNVRKELIGLWISEDE